MIPIGIADVLCCEGVVWEYCAAGGVGEAGKLFAGNELDGFLRRFLGGGSETCARFCGGRGFFACNWFGISVL